MLIVINRDICRKSYQENFKLKSHNAIVPTVLPRKKYSLLLSKRKQTNVHLQVRLTKSCSIRNTDKLWESVYELFIRHRKPFNVYWWWKLACCALSGLLFPGEFGIDSVITALKRALLSCCNIWLKKAYNLNSTISFYNFLTNTLKTGMIKVLSGMNKVVQIYFFLFFVLTLFLVLCKV